MRFILQNLDFCFYFQAVPLCLIPNLMLVGAKVKPEKSCSFCTRILKVILRVSNNNEIYTAEILLTKCKFIF